MGILNSRKPENGHGNSHGFPGILGIRAGLEDWENSEELEPEPSTPYHS